MFKEKLNIFNYVKISKNNYPMYLKHDRAERHVLKSRFLLFILLFSPLFLEGRRKGVENNQSRDLKLCLSARSLKLSLEVVKLILRTISSPFLFLMYLK